MPSWPFLQAGQMRVSRPSSVGGKKCGARFSFSTSMTAERLPMPESRKLTASSIDGMEPSWSLAG